MDDKIIDLVPIIEKRKKEKLKEENESVKLYEVVDVIVNLSIILDSLEKSYYADKLSDIVSEMFNDENLTSKDWGHNRKD